MADRKISDLTALTTPATGDLLPIVDVSEAAAADKNKSITVGELLRGAPDGTAAAPGIAFESDGGNGMFLGGTDILAFSTGGTQAVTIDASQRLGVGTSSPTHTLEVAGKIAVTGTESALGNSSIPTIYRSGSDSGSYPFNNFGHLVIQPRCDGANRDIVFATGTSGANKVVIDSSGRLGVGTTSPDTSLEVEAPSSNTTPQSQNYPATQSGAMLTNTTQTDGVYTALSLRASNAGGTTQAAHIYAQSTNSGFSPELHFSQRTGSGTSQSRMVIDSSGRVGIGTSSPQERFVVSNSGAEGVEIACGVASNTNVIQNYNRSTSAYSSLRFDAADYAFRVGTSQKVTIDSSGRVGIGTTSPGRLLEVSSADDVLIKATSTDAGAYIEFADNSTTQDVRLGAVGNAIAFDVNSERMRIDSSGRLLVGTSSARSDVVRTLNVEGAGDTGLTIVRNEANAAGAMLEFGKSRGTTVGSSTAVQDDDDIGMIRFRAADGTDMAEEVARITASIDGTPGSNDVPGRLVFSTTADGASSPTERMRISQNGFTVVHSESSGRFAVKNAGTSGPNAAIYLAKGAATATSNGTTCFVVRQDGDVENTNNSYGALSDIKLKENIVDSNSQWDDLKALQVRNYNFKPETGHGTHTQIGLVAQEVELVSPGLVSESPDRDEEGNDLGTTTKSVNYSVLYMKAVKALQEAMERIETLEAKVAALEAN